MNIILFGYLLREHLIQNFCDFDDEKLTICYGYGKGFAKIIYCNTDNEYKEYKKMFNNIVYRGEQQ